MNRLGLLTMVIALVLTGCGGTKVYESSKTVIYNGAMYNLSAVKTVSSKIDGIIGADKQTVDLRKVDKKQFEAYVKQYDQVFVKMYFDLDDQEMVYSATNVDSWRDFSKMKDDFQDAGEKITKLMKDKKATQLKL